MPFELYSGSQHSSPEITQTTGTEPSSHNVHRIYHLLGPKPSQASALQGRWATSYDAAPQRALCFAAGYMGSSFITLGGKGLHLGLKFKDSGF